MKCLIDNFEVNHPCSKACRLYGDCVAAFLEARKQNVRTNADRIRAMSDEELANMFAEFAEENPSDDANAWYEWLTKPAEVE